MHEIYNHGYSDPYLMDERSSQLASIPEEDTLILSKEPHHSSTEATNTSIIVEQDISHPYANDTSSQLGTERDDQWSNAGTSTNTSNISHPTQLADFQGCLSQLETQMTTLSKSIPENDQVMDLQGRLSQLETQMKTLSKSITENEQSMDFQGRLSQLETQLKAINKSQSKSEPSDQLEDIYTCLSQVETQLKLLSKSHSENGLKEKNEQIYRLNLAVISLFVLCLILTVGIALCAILVLKNS